MAAHYKAPGFWDFFKGPFPLIAKTTRKLATSASLHLVKISCHSSIVIRWDRSPRARELELAMSGKR